MGEGLIDLAKKSARSTVWLTIGQGLSSTIGGLITIYISRVLKEVLFAIYSVSLIPISIGVLFANLGVSNALTKYVAQDIAKDKLKASKWISTGLLFELANGIFISVIVMLSSQILGSKFLGRTETVDLIRSIAFMILFMNLFTATYGILNALYLTKFIAISQIIGAITRLILTVYLISSGWGVLGALLGFMSYYIVASVLAIGFFLRSAFQLKIRILNFSLTHLKGLLKYGVPLTLNSFFQVIGINTFSALASIYTASDSQAVNPHLTSAALGNYFAANALLVILLIFNAPLLQSLFPSFSRISDGSAKDLGLVLNASIFITSMILAPVIFTLMGLAEPIIFFVFGVEYELAPLYLMILSLSYIPAMLGLTPISSFLLGVGDTVDIMIGGLTSFIVGLITAYIIIPMQGALGLALVLVIFNFTMWGVYTLVVKIKFKLPINYKRIAKVLLVAVMMVLILRLYVMFAMNPLLDLLGSIINNGGLLSSLVKYLFVDIIGGIIGGISYFILLALMRVLRESDFDLILSISKTLGPIHTPVKFIVAIMKKIMRI